MSTQSWTVTLPNSGPYEVTVHPDGTVETNLLPVQPAPPEDEDED
jgi:hypothetical protein